MIHRWVVVLATAGIVGTAGCSAAGEPAVVAAADRFVGAVDRHDGAAACAMLTEYARHDTETFGRNCPTQLAGLPDPGAVQQVEVWGDTAQVRLAHGTLFLLQFPDGWRVSAAGCVPQEDAPYRCEVQG
jgi:hypothetical protein